MKTLDNFLDRITMYRLVFYELIFLLVAAAALGFFGVLALNPFFLFYSAAFIFCVSWITNAVFARMFRAPSNPESTWITALILALLISPPAAFFDTHYLPLAFWAAAWAIASKYILAIRSKHLFNPAALGIAVSALALGLPATWWIGTPALIPFVLLGGLLIVRKIRRFDLWWAFLGAFSIGTLYAALTSGRDLLSAFSHSFLYAPAFFFATVMLTEPATAPPQKALRIAYAALVGLLFLPDVHIGSVYSTPELALLVGNVFAYAVSPKYKLTLVLQETVRLSRDVYEFVFALPRPFAYAPGQYMEWTLPHAHADSRSVRRYFTLASSPTEKEVRLGVKFYEPGSTFKKALLSLRPGARIAAGGLAGEFTLPKNKKAKIAFIAGGIGSTPFRSMIRYLLDKGERRDIIFLYSNRSPEDAVYKELFDRAEKELGIRTVYAFDGTDVALPQGAIPRIDARAIAENIPDHAERIFYISGPQKMVAYFDEMLRSMGVRPSHIKTDYFPGFA